VGSWIERRARIAPDRVALVYGDRSWTYGELAGRVRRLAGGLRRLGVGPGDRVSWLGPNHPAFLEAFFASGLLGAVLAPVNHRLDGGQIHAILEDTEPAVLMAHETADLSFVPSSVPHRVAVDGSPADAIAFERLLDGREDTTLGAAVEFDDLCMLPRSSGTTGTPKGIMLTHANVTWNVVNFLSCADFRGDDVTIAVAPFFRVGGTGVNVLPVLFLGGTVVVPTGADADDILQLIERHRVTVGFGNPDSLQALVEAPAWPAADLSSVRFILTGGAPVPERLIRLFLERDLSLLQGYGLSEAGPLALLLDHEHALEKIGSAGRPPLLVDTRIERADGTAAAAGETGELLVRGPNVMAGYWRQPEATARALSSDGWLRTGDAARSDDDGFLWIVDRIADAFESDGQVVYPGDVERVLLEHPAVADAGVAQIAGADVSPAIVALVVRMPGAEATDRDVMEFARARLPAAQAPATLTFVDRLPRSSVGKLVRSELRALARSEA
jgi:fatty-acyl-CoA synthase